jgi:preprotein translocase subunit SecE
MAKAIAVADEQQSSGMDRFKSRPRELIEFLKDVRSEMRKVVTPTRPEVQSTTAIVIVTVFIFAAYFALVDFVVGQGVTQLIHHFTQR